MEQHEAALTTLQQSIAAVPELASRIDEHERALASVPQLESKLASRMEQHEAALTTLQQSIAAVPELESKLTSRMEQQEQTVSAIQQSIGDLPQLAKRLESQIEQHHATVETVSQSLNFARAQIVSIETRVNAAQAVAQGAEAGVSQLADMQGALIEEVKTFGATMQAHAAAIESIRASLARSDDFMERVVEALESLQSMVLEQARDRVGA
jgi:chromosome segregation ATPase